MKAFALTLILALRMTSIGLADCTLCGTWKTSEYDSVKNRHIINIWKIDANTYTDTVYFNPRNGRKHIHAVSAGYWHKTGDSVFICDTVFNGKNQHRDSLFTDSRYIFKVSKDSLVIEEPVGIRIYTRTR